MKKMKLFSISLLLMSAFFMSISALSYPAVIDKILVVVNNEVITQGEVDRIIGPAYQQYKAVLSEDELIKKLDTARQAVLAQLIEEKLILSEAKKQNIGVDEKDVKAKVEEARKRFASDEAFEEALAEQHLSLKDLKEKFREQLMAKTLIDMKIGSKISVTPNEITDYYNAHVQEFTQPEEIKLRNILIKQDENADVKKATDLVSEISNRLKAGGDFAEIAKIYSEGPGAKEGGVMGYVKRGDLLPEIEKVVFSLKEREVSDMVRTKVGYHFFKVEEKKAPVTVSMSDARRTIEDTLWMGKMKEKSRGWIEELRKHAYIAFK